MDWRIWKKRSSGTTKMKYKDEAHADLNLQKHLPRAFIVVKNFTSSSVRRFEAKVPEAAKSNSAAVFII